jgi:hypothetical protein
MADDASLEQEVGAPSGQAAPACACDDGGEMPPLQTNGESLSQRQQKEDEMVTALLGLLARRTARAYLAERGEEDAAGHAA